MLGVVGTMATTSTSLVSGCLDTAELDDSDSRGTDSRGYERWMQPDHGRIDFEYVGWDSVRPLGDVTAGFRNAMIGGTVDRIWLGKRLTSFPSGRYAPSRCFTGGCRAVWHRAGRDRVHRRRANEGTVEFGDDFGDVEVEIRSFESTVDGLLRVDDAMIITGEFDVAEVGERITDDPSDTSDAKVEYERTDDIGDMSVTRWSIAAIPGVISRATRGQRGGDHRQSVYRRRQPGWGSRIRRCSRRIRRDGNRRGTRVPRDRPTRRRRRRKLRPREVRRVPERRGLDGGDEQHRYLTRVDGFDGHERSVRRNVRRPRRRDRSGARIRSRHRRRRRRRRFRRRPSNGIRRGTNPSWSEGVRTVGFSCSRPDGRGRHKTRDWGRP
ncbi:hypothetical protein D8S78_16110 [Natrialba swarupiae]|nr:hypothetical protein [Natrialba swarupiae]